MEDEEDDKCNVKVINVDVFDDEMLDFEEFSLFVCDKIFFDDFGLELFMNVLFVLILSEEF